MYTTHKTFLEIFFSHQNQQPVVIVDATSTEDSFRRSIVITAHHNWSGG